MTSERPNAGAGDRPDRDDPEGIRRKLERILPELIRRVIETGVDKLQDGPENLRQFVSELRLPKEALGVLLSQLDETKSGLYRAVAKEVRDFLDHTNLAEELGRVLTTLSLEVKTEVRFIPNDQRLGVKPVPDVRSKVSLKRDKTPDKDAPGDPEMTNSQVGASQSPQPEAREAAREEKKT